MDFNSNDKNVYVNRTYYILYIHLDLDFYIYVFVEHWI